jgi:hypothetical protein
MALVPSIDCGRLHPGTTRSRASPYQHPACRKVSRQVVQRDRACAGTHYLQAHHVIPRAHGGPDTPRNLINALRKLRRPARSASIRPRTVQSREPRRLNDPTIASASYVKDSLRRRPWLRDVYPMDLPHLVAEPPVEGLIRRSKPA